MSSARNVGESATCPVCAQPSAEIPRVGADAGRESADAGPPVFGRGQLVRGGYVDLVFGRRRLRTQDPLSSDEGNSSADDCRVRERERYIYIYVDLFFGGGQAVTAQLIVVSICAAGKGEAACTPPGNLTEKSELD